MTKLEYIFQTNFSNFSSTLRDTSFDKAKSEYLCNDKSQKVFSFDDLVKQEYPLKQPASFDAILFQENVIYCIEFKNQKPSQICNTGIEKKLVNSQDVIKRICNGHSIQQKDYTFVFCVAFAPYSSNARYKRGVAKNIILFGLERYKGKYFDKILTNDINYFTTAYKKKFLKELICT